MAVKTAPSSEPRTRALFAEEQQFIAPGIQTIALLSQLAIARGSGATLTDLDGRTYAGATVDLPSLQVSALGVCVAMAVASGARGAEAAVVLGDEPVSERVNR